MPMVACLNQHGIDAELWFENRPDHQGIISQTFVPQRHLGTDFTPNPLTFCRRLDQYRKQLRAARPTIIHAHQMRASVIPLLAGYLEHVPVRVYHNHGLPYLGYRGALRRLLRGLERLNIRLATHVLLVSHSNLEAARADRLLPDSRGTVLAAGSAVGIDLSEFSLEKFNDLARISARKKLGIAGNPFVLAYVGRPVRRKGFQLLLNTWAQSWLSSKGHVLLVAGCTPAECEQARGRPIQGVNGLGYLPDLKEFYAASDAVVLPSEHEGFPYSLLEGAAAQRALIGTDIAGIRCAILPGDTGLLVPVRNEEALRLAVERLASDPALCRRFGQNARQRVEREFDRKIVLKSLLDFYHAELLRDKPESQP